jgi:hypothetical protein
LAGNRKRKKERKKEKVLGRIIVSVKNLKMAL